MTDPDSAAPQWLSNTADLRALLAHRPSRVALDTEFIRERTYWPQLALVQLAFAGADGAMQVLLVDPLVPGMCKALAPLLADCGVLKVMHSPSEDLVALRHACGEVPRPLFDTQAAAALAGIGVGVGYQKLVEQLTGTILAKGETRSDWLRRPLSPSQLEYAADDVRHLFEMHDVLVGLLAPLGRVAWADEDAARTVSNAQADAGERWPHLALRSAQFLERDAQQRLLRLLRWRERHARSSDRPKSWVLDNELAVAIARQAPTDAAALDVLMKAHPKAPLKLADVLLATLHTPLDDEADAPLARDTGADRQRLRALQQAVTAQAEALGIADGTLASRRWLEALLEDATWPDALQGWRRAQLEPALAPLLAR